MSKESPVESRNRKTVAAREYFSGRGRECLEAAGSAFSDFLFVLDRSGVITDYFVVHPELLYMPPDEFLGRDIRKILPHPASEIIGEAINHALKFGGIKETVYSLPYPEGDRWFELAIADQGQSPADSNKLVFIARDITWRKKAEDDLRASRDRLNRTEAIAHLGSWELDLMSNRLIWSDEVFRIFGQPPQSFAATYEAFLELVHPEDRAALDMAYRNSLCEGGEAYQMEHRVVRADTGAVRWVEEKCFHVRDKEGRVVCSHGMVIDVTERRQAEEALKESEARHRAIHDNLPNGLIYQIDSGEDGQSRRFTFVSQGVEQLHGVTTDEVMKDSGAIYRQVIDKELVAGLEAKAAESMTPFNVEARIRLASGEKRWRWFASAPRRLPNRHLIWDGIELDITERKQAEEALRRSEAKYRLLYENMEDAFIIADMKGRLLETNPAFERLVQYSKEEVTGLSYKVFTPPEWIKTDEMAFRQVAERGYTDIIEKEFIRKDGSRVPVEMRGCLLRDEAGNPAGVWAVIRDNTERKQAEQLLRGAHDELERRVEERTAELRASERALSRSREELRALLSRLEQAREDERIRIARDIHDDFGQSLTAIKMDLRRIEKLAEKISPALLQDKIQKRASGAISLADSALSMVQKLAAELRPGVLDKLGLCTALQYEARCFEERHGIRCTMAVASRLSEVPPLVATALFRIFQECLTNIARHAGASRVSVRLGMADRSLKLCVRDNGRGIGEAAVNNPASLGLIGIRERAVALGGEAAFRRGNKNGTVVEVRIPLSRAKGGSRRSRKRGS